MDNIYNIERNDFTILLKEINDIPDKLNVIGNLPNKNNKILCIVGARKHSNYGKECTIKLVSSLKGNDITIVSGMALGIDTIVHRTAMENGLQTIAFPGSGLNMNVIYPHMNRKLAEEIIYSGGGLISEFENNQTSALWTFPKRNRLMAGISHAVIVVEAELISGTLITSRLALDYNRDVGAVPGSIYSSLSSGPNMLISKGAKVIRNRDDILELLDMDIPNNFQPNILDQINLNKNENIIINLLKIEPYNSDELINNSKLNIKEFNNAISMLEINNLIEESNGKYKLK